MLLPAVPDVIVAASVTWRRRWACPYLCTTPVLTSGREVLRVLDVCGCLLLLTLLLLLLLP